MLSLFRTITLMTALALLLFVGLHAVVPHAHASSEGYHWSEIPPMAHAENKIFLVVFAALVLFAVSSSLASLVLSRSVPLFFDAVRTAIRSVSLVLRYQDALRRGKIHSKAH